MQTDARRKIVLDALTDASLMRCLDAHIGDSGIHERYAAIVHQLNSKRFILPVYGIQGTGKSTFLNALVFANPTLPVDADETTCVPVEIVHGVSPSPMARAHFSDGHVEDLPATEEGLKRLVHNEDNPGNRLGVSRIVVESNDPILENGLVLVDLPGVGSLTKENLETTKKYTAEASGVLFMIRTVPPITRSESVLIAGNWARMPTAIFVQNRWSDETNDEAAAGHEHNVAVLSDLAKRCRVSLNGPPVVHQVNAFAALEGRLMDDPSAALQSGISEVRDVLRATSATWPSIILENAQGAVRQDLAVATGSAETKLKDLSQSRESTLIEIDQERTRFQQYFADLERRSGAARTDLESFSQEVSMLLQQWASASSSSLRNAMRTNMRKRILDGPRLSRAMRDEQSVALDEIYSQVEEKLLSKRDHIQSHFEGVSGWQMQKPQTQRTVDKNDSTKYENIAAPVGGALVGLGGAFAGAKIGAAFGAAGGPAGAVVGAIVGVLGGLLGSWLGGKVKNYVTESRVDSIEDDVFRAIDDFVSSTQREISATENALNRELLGAVDRWMRSQKGSHEKERGERLSVLEMSNDQRLTVAAQLEANLVQLRQWSTRLGGGNHA